MSHASPALVIFFVVYVLSESVHPALLGCTYVSYRYVNVGVDFAILDLFMGTFPDDGKSLPELHIMWLRRL
jgi:hypothetical protein